MDITKECIDRYVVAYGLDQPLPKGSVRITGANGVTTVINLEEKLKKFEKEFQKLSKMTNGLRYNQTKPRHG